MEFNKQTITNTTATTSTPEVVADKIKLTSPERVGVASINNALKISTTVESTKILVSHDLRDLKNMYNKDDIKTSLVTIYGKNNRLEMSSRDIETLTVPISELPARLEYNFTVLEGETPVDYKADYLIPVTSTNIVLPITGKKSSSVSEVPSSEAIPILDNEIVNIKNNLQNLSSIYDSNENKVVTLQSYIQTLNTRINNLTKQLEDVAEKIKDL